MIAVDIVDHPDEEAEAEAQDGGVEEAHGAAHTIAWTADTVVAALTSAVRVAS